MTKKELFETLRENFKQIVEENNLDTSKISIKSKGLTPEEAIGNTKRRDYPILTGAEIMLMAEYKGSIGQAFTSAPADYEGSLSDIIEADIIENEYDRALFIASLNAVMRHLGMIEGTVHCKNDGPELCANQYVPFLKEEYGSPKILQVGYQPALLDKLAGNFDLRIVDLNPKNIGKVVNGVTVEDGHSFADILDWADIVLCTGSTIANGSIVDYMDIGKEVIFYGTTLAGAAKLLGLKRVCFCSE